VVSAIAQSAPRRPTPQPIRAAVWIVAGLFVVALALRWKWIHQSLFGDEMILYIDVHGRSLGQVTAVVHDTEKTPPLYFLLAWLLTKGGDPTLLVRIPTFVVGVATVPLVYLVGRRTVGRAGALVATAWFALSPFEIFYGSEARSYALVTACVTLSTLALLLALEQPRLRWWALYVVAATAAVYSHYIGALVLVPQAVWALWVYRDGVREQLISHALVVLLWLPWLPSFLVQFRHSSKEAGFLAGVAPLSVHQVSQIVTQSLVGLPFVQPHDFPGWPVIIVLVVLVVGQGAFIAYRLYENRRSPASLARSRVGLILVLALFPIVGLSLYSLRPHTSFLLPRNLSVGVPYVLVFFGWLLTYSQSKLRLVMVTAALIALGIGTVAMIGSSRQRPDTRAAARYVDAHAPANAPVVDFETISGYNQKPARAFRLYLQRPHPVYPISQWATAWARARRSNAPLFVSYPIPVAGYLVPPPADAARYRIVAQKDTEGSPFGIDVREYAPR
jgi:hypothetical protein